MRWFVWFDDDFVIGLRVRHMHDGLHGVKPHFEFKLLHDALTDRAMSGLNPLCLNHVGGVAATAAA